MVETEIAAAGQVWQKLEDIENTLHDNAAALARIRSSRQDVNVAHVIELAKRISLTSYIPAGWREGMPLVNAFPPAPLPEQMRLGMASSSLAPEISATRTSEDMEIDRSAVVVPSSTEERLRARLQEFLSLGSTEEAVMMMQTETEADNREDSEEMVQVVEDDAIVIRAEMETGMPAATVRSRHTNISFAMDSDDDEEDSY
jgi:hypothetical protein